MCKNYSKGIQQIKGFDLFIDLYVKKYYKEYKVIKSIILSNCDSDKFYSNTIFQLSKNGEIVYNKDLPTKIIKFLNENPN